MLHVRPDATSARDSEADPGHLGRERDAADSRRDRGGIRLQVNRDDVEEAATLLSEPTPEGFDIEGLGKYQQPQCPRCRSFDIAHHAGLDKRFALPALWFTSVPIPVRRNEWKCQSCGAEWRDSQSEKAEPESSE